jgi:hypothetical protein
VSDRTEYIEIWCDPTDASKEPEILTFKINPAAPLLAVTDAIDYARDLSEKTEPAWRSIDVMTENRQILARFSPLWLLTQEAAK